MTSAVFILGVTLFYISISRGVRAWQRLRVERALMEQTRRLVGDVSRRAAVPHHGAASPGLGVAARPGNPAQPAAPPASAGRDLNP